MGVLMHALGRLLQLLALLVMPSAMWVAHFRRDEAGSITIFAGSIAVFFAGYLISQFSKK
jgi:hypothetical protein